MARDPYHELRIGFTAAVSHELRTPLARILVLLDSAELPGADVANLIDQARAEVEHAGALINEILDRKSTRLNSSHIQKSRMPSSA